MAWREVGKKGIRASITKALNSTTPRDAVLSISASTLEDAVKSTFASIRCIPEFSADSVRCAYNGKGVSRQFTIRDMVGKLTEQAKPAMPVEIEGLRGLPMAGDDIIVVDSEERARMLSAGRKKRLEKVRLVKIGEGRMETPDTSEAVPERVEMPIIVKADVQGTVQEVTDALKSLNRPQVFVNVVHVGVGPISQSDVDLAQACGACIVGFNVRNLPSSLSLEATRASILRQNCIV